METEQLSEPNLNELHLPFVLQQREWSQPGSEIVPLTSPAERGQRRHLCGSAAPGLQRVAWRLSNQRSSAPDRLESFERQLGQLWGCAPTGSPVLLSQSSLMSTLPRLFRASLFALHLICPRLRWKTGTSLSPQITTGRPSGVPTTFLRSNTLTQLSSRTLSEYSRGRIERQHQCSQAWLYMILGCQAKWDFMSLAHRPERFLGVGCLCSGVSNGHKVRIHSI